MAVRTVADHSGPDAARLALPFLIAAALYLVVLAVGGNLLNDADSYWHLVVGNWILANGFPIDDPFSLTFAGEPWIAKEWLSQILLTLAHRLGGWTGVVVLSGVTIALAFALLTRFLADHLAPVAIVAFAAIAFVLVAPHLVARPHVLALPVMIAWIGGLVRAVDRGTAPPYALLLLMVVWANLHGGFTLGILLVAAAGLDAIVAAERGKRTRLAGRWLLFGFLTLAAASLTPYGPESILVTYRVLSLGEALSIIAEWRPADFSRLAGFEVVLLFAGGLALHRGFVLRPVRILIILGLLHMALSAARNSEVLGLIAPLFLAAPLAKQFPGLRRGEPAPTRWNAAALIAGLLTLLVPATIALAMVGDYAPNRRITPAAAVDAIRLANPGPVLNDYDFGGYLVGSGIAPFIDGRTELYGGAFTVRHHRAITLADLDDFVRLLDEYAIGATLLSPTTPAVALLDRLPGWRRIHTDDIAIVHVRGPAPSLTPAARPAPLPASHGPHRRPLSLPRQGPLGHAA